MREPGILYPCTVMHRRHRPLQYLFRYRIFSLLLDIDRLAELDRSRHLLSVGRFNLFSFHPQDHLPEGETDLRAWADRVLVENGIRPHGLRVRLLCMPRVLGWGFNPLSIWYCERPDGKPVAAICEVHNTFGERHCYLLRSRGDWPIRTAQAKAFHVSPFMDVSGDYAFVLDRPAQQLRILIAQAEQGETVLSASQLGEQLALTDRNLVAQFARIPLQTAKVLGAIHWQALKLWLRGAPFFRKPPPPVEEIS